MKNQIGNMLRKLKKNQRFRAIRRKQLRLESLEGRRLLAADFVVTHPHHNDLIAEDVSGDYDVTPVDALLVVNAINDGQMGELPDVEPGKKSSGPLYDTNGDNQLSPIDALTVINFLNGEGETSPTAIFSHEFVDVNGAPLTANTVTVGERFSLLTSVRDTRGFGAQGINSPYLDIAFDNTDPFDVAVGEIQTIKFFFDKLDASDTSSTFTLSLDGQTTDPIALFTAGGSPRSDVALAAAMQTALAALPNVGDGNVSVVVDLIAKADDAANGISRFNFEARFSGDLTGVDLPLMVLDGSNVGVLPGETFISEIAEVLAGDQSTPAAEAAAVIFADLYDFAREAEVTANEFNEIGAASQLIPLPNPAETKLVFTIPMVATAPGVVTFTPNQADLSPSRDILTGVTVIPPSMVDYGAAFTLTVQADPTSPVANDDTLSMAEDGSLTLNGNVTANDTVTSPRTLSVLSAATIPGTTVGSLSGLVYTPPANFVGTDTITYIAQDSTGLDSNVATVTINVTAVNDPPEAVDDNLAVDEETTDNVLDVLANDNGGPGESSDTLTITAVGATDNGGSVSIIGGGSQLSYTPDPNFIGTETFTYTIEDQGGLTSMATVRVEVEPLILPRGRTDFVTTEEGTPITIDVLNNDRANDGAMATLVSVSDGTHGTVTIDDNSTPSDMTDDRVTYTPNDPNFFGSDTFTYVMNDTAGTGADSTATVSITVTDINDTPVLAGDEASGTEDTPATIALTTLLANDSPGPGEMATQSLTITSVAALSSGGSVAIVGDNVVYTPDVDFNGDFSFTYTAEDNGSPVLSSTATVVISVAAVNDDPIAADDTGSVDEDASLTIAVSAVLSNDAPGPATATDEAGQTLSVASVSGTSANGGSVGLSGGDITYTPAADFFGEDTFTYSLSDGEGGSATGTVTITVNPINDAPTAGEDSLIAFKDFPRTYDAAELLANDSPGPANESDQTLTITSVSPTADTNGTVVLNSDGTITYTPDADYIGPASFTYTVEDNGATGGENVNSAMGTVNLTVREFQPTTIGGTVWVDETNDGVIDDAERRLGAIQVTISGMSLGQVVAPQTQLTLSDGSFSFENLGPGDYTLSYAKPAQFRDGVDVAGSLGDSDSIENQFSINVPQPGGFAANDYNFALLGLEAGLARTLDQLASRYVVLNPSLAYNGAYFGIGEDNSLLWTAKLDGFDDAVFAEAVLSDSGREVLLTVVESDHDVFTASLGRGEFVKMTDASGNTIVRVLGDASSFAWQQVNLATPPFTAAKYLDAVDAVFDQEEW